MQAQYVFSADYAQGLIHPSEKEVIKRMANSFNFTTGFWSIQNLLLFSSALLVASYVLFSLFSKTPQQPMGNNMQPIDPIINVERDTSKIESESIKTNNSIETVEIKQETLIENSNQINVLQKENLIGGAHTNYFPSDYKQKKERTVFPADPPVFEGNVDLKNFILKTDSFFMKDNSSEIKYEIGDSNGILFGSDYYCGEPFKKGFEDMVYFNMGELLTKEKEDYKKRMAKRTRIYYIGRPSLFKIPNSFRMYCKPENIEVRTHQLIVRNVSDEAIKQYIQPFYFRKYEVTNGEYYEFLNWVQTTNRYGDAELYRQTILNNPDSASEKEIPEYKKYETLVKAVDFNKVFVYQFFDSKSAGIVSINVFPDDSCFMKDYSYSYNDPITYLYFVYPGYSEYPVVGVSYYQVLAFLDWKTHFHQKQLDEKEIPLKISYKLPSNIQWETANSSVGNSYSQWHVKGDDSWRCDLSMVFSTKNLKANSLRLFLNENSIYSTYSIDGSFYPYLVHPDIDNYPDYSLNHTGSNGICWLGGNVSEWMRESYEDNWLPIYKKYIELVESQATEESELIRLITDYYNKQNAGNGKLVRGCNWMDERYSNIYGINVAGVYAKKFVDPSAQHSTLGFRYVIEVGLVE
ncbi:MAG: SUMF1/EgtB/PvdO family nonheme iron enzyme [Bacteroidetes bacterium]|nr:SUMF1/EgtB/PvdO family nonheme iron enzyme [Bacteroidota bacterium]